MENIILTTDSYKLSHDKQYPTGSQRIFSYFEPRVGAKWNQTVFFGLQIILKKYLQGNVVSKEFIEEAKALTDAHIGPNVFNEKGWTRLLEKHGGKLPVKIRAVPEGMVIPVDNALMTVENTDDEFPWLVNFLETLLVQVWYPSTVATQSREMKKIINRYLEKTGDPAGLGFKLHDFGFRGVSSVETAGMGGAAHLVNFMGTDTIAGLRYAMKYYNTPMCGFSIPASEHSTITSWGRERESLAMENMLDKYPAGLVACVSDSYDIFNACQNIWGEELKHKILARDGVLVVRPDSGNAVKLIPELIKILGEKIGQTKNSKGYFVLDPHIRLIQGDGINIDSLEKILEAVEQNGYSADNLAFGSGGGLLQNVNRDTCRYAFKCSAIKVNNEWRDVYKAPITDGSKNSKRGILTLYKNGDTFVTAERDRLDLGEDMLKTVFEDGEIVREYTFDEVRKNAVL